MLIDFRESGKEGEKQRCERETLTSCLPVLPDWGGTAPQPGHVCALTRN